MSMRRHRSLAVILGAIAVLLVAMPAASASAASSWWQILTGSRPTNLWVPSDNVQEIETTSGPFFSFEGVAAKVEIEGTIVGCLGTGTAKIACGAVGFPAEETAAELEATLETAFGTDVAVTGGPVGGDPFLVTVPGQPAPPIVVAPVEGGGQKAGFASSRVLSSGGSGRLVLTITNLGDAPVDGTSTPVTIVDELPAGVEATAVEGFAGVQNKFGPVECTVESGSLVSCAFEGTLPSYESIEVEVFVNLVGEPPVVEDPGKVTVSGGNAPIAIAGQEIHVSPEETPFGIEQFSAQAEEEGGAIATQAGSHPFQLTTTIQFNSGPMISRDAGVEQPAQPRNIRFPLPVGLVGNATAVPRCDLEDFFAINEDLVNDCPAESAVGVSSVTMTGLLGFVRVAVPVFNLPPAEGEPARFGFTVAGDPVVIDTEVDPDDKYRIIASVSNSSQLVQILASTVTFWGAPGDPRHDNSRGWNCAYSLKSFGPCERPENLSEDALLRLPVSCASPLGYDAEAEPWNTPLGSVVDRMPFLASALGGCNQVPFNPTVATAPTSRSAGGPSGFDFSLTMPNAGLLNKDAIAEGQAKKVEVDLPEGMTINPSSGDGLAGCSPADLARETASSPQGAGCPEASKIGEVKIKTPLLEEEASGSLYVATPHDNPFGSLIALYLVAKIPERGILIKQAGKVTADPNTGRLTTTFDDLPQLPFSSFDLHFREGGRAPLLNPPACGTYDVVTRFVPWSAQDPDNPALEEVVTRTSSFTVDSGCPNGGPLPFHPDLSAGTLNNAAGKHSQLNLRLTRKDDEQEFTHLSVKMPRGLIGKLAGIPFCPDASIAAARARTGPNGGAEELAQPSCPAASQIGRTLVGAGVGDSLTSVPGRLYLAGPYNGAKLSVVAITSAKVGPFDLGTVVIREALKVDPETAEVSVDAANSDPIPHIIQGIPVHARDIRVYVDRPGFVLNPTSCKRMFTTATVVGAGQSLGSSADDQVATASAPFQVASCESLAFKPRISISLLGGMKRTDTPRLKAVVRPQKGGANIAGAQVTLPHTVFLEQAHIRTVCTRVQFNAGAGDGAECPKGAVYGRARAISPLLDEPLVGPVYLRSSNHALPDLVAALHSKKVDINLAGRIDTGKGGGIRTTFARVPDAPVSRFVLQMQGGRKGLVTNSIDLCASGKQRALAEFQGQNGKQRTLRPVIKTRCGKK
jgi:hypothetical protein